MEWLSRFFTSSIGRKWIMSLTGLFLIVFLVVHLAGNILLLKEDNGYAFNTYSYEMTHNPLIVLVSYGLYFFILLHAIMGIAIARKNKAARAQGYVMKSTRDTSWASRHMALMGLLIFAFLVMHMGDFWLKVQLGQLDVVTYEGFPHPVDDLYSRVMTAFSIWWIVLLYIIGQIALFFHLKHGFYLAFQDIGWSHPKYTPIIKGVGLAYSILIPFGFAFLPLYVFFTR